MWDIAREVVSIADACLGGLRGRSALVIGPDELRRPYAGLLQQAGMKYVYQEDTPHRATSIIPHIQLLISIPGYAPDTPLLTADVIAEGCSGRRTTLLIFDISETPSVEELAGLLPTICLYTPSDRRHILAQSAIRQLQQSFSILP